MTLAESGIGTAESTERPMAAVLFGVIRLYVDDFVQVNHCYGSEYPLTVVPIRSILGLPCMEDPMTATIVLAPEIIPETVSQ